jgi:hypothetical protein
MPTLRLPLIGCGRVTGDVISPEDAEELARRGITTTARTTPSLSAVRNAVLRRVGRLALVVAA